MKGVGRFKKVMKHMLGLYLGWHLEIKIILHQILNKLRISGYAPKIYLKSKKGFISKSKIYMGYHNINIFEIVLYRKSQVLNLILNLLSLSEHSDKIRKMEFILENQDNKWKEIKDGWIDLRNEIKKELLKNQI